MPFNEPGARIAFEVVVGAWALSEFWVGVRSHLNRGGSRLDRRSRLVVIGCVYAGVAGAVLMARHADGAAIGGARWPLFVAGLLLMGAGIVVRQWSVALLGRYFTTDVRVHSGQTVVERGPYRWVRHPSYAGLILVLVGFGLALGNWASLAVVGIVPTAGIVVRIGVEERALLDGLGEPYRRFAAGRPRLFPGVW